MSGKIQGRITYITTLPSTPLPSPFTVADFYALENVFANSVPAGSRQDIFLYWGYENLDPDPKDDRNVSRAASGVVDIVNFGSTLNFRLSVKNVIQDRSQVNEYEILNALNEECMNGTVLTWYPDFINFPDEYYSCVANRRIAPKRIGKRNLFQFDFDLMVLADVQVPSTVPPFVMA
ncbi:MAG TPA: hypothetical protein VK149_03525 [Sideroxyarcus sp.]|nr:hypothetical protein [Sideroxyarcus sp.]